MRGRKTGFKTKTIVINDLVFSADLLVQRGGTAEELRQKYSKKIDLPITPAGENPARRGHYISHHDVKNGAIWLHSEASLGTVAHEALHATCEVLRKSGIELTEETEEIYAYYQQFLINQILTKLFGWK